MKILVLQKPGIVSEQRALIETSLSELDGADVALASSPEEAAVHADATVLLTPTFDWLPDVLERLPRIEWVHFLSAGVDRIWPMDVAWSRYHLSKSVGVHASTISEYVLGAILYALKGFGTFHRQQQQRTWHRFWLDESEGKTLGIVGVGTIGTRLAKHATALGMRVIGTVRTPREIPNVDAVYGLGEVERVLEASDFVVLLVPLTDQTRGMMGADAFRAMRDGAWLINVARGEVVDEPALIAALQSGRLGGAVLDVFDEEPLRTTSPLWDLPNVLITPHVAGTTQHYMARALDVFKDNYRAFARGAPLATPVSIARGY
jgi:phosphoglycerate dehydrogenase-like enzyme